MIIFSFIFLKVSRLIKLNKIYTKREIKAKPLGNGERVPKDNIRVSAYGTVDELNACIGVVTLYAREKLHDKLKNIQNDLFDLGADLCVPISKESKKRLRVSPKQIEILEKEIDEMNRHFEPLNSFILPGGCKTATFLHLARTFVDELRDAL